MSKAFRWVSGSSGVHFSLVVPALFLTLSAKPGPSAADILRRAFDSQFKNRVEMLQMSATPSSPGATMYKLYVDPSYGVHVNILSPTALTNTRSVDNRREMWIYYPGQREIEVRVSPQKFRLPTDRRVKMVERNFVLSVRGTDESVAGRRVYVVDLKAKNGGVGNRALYVDREKGNILRSTLSDGKENMNLLETVTVNYDVKLKKEEFRKPAGVEKKLWGPVDLAKFSNSSKKLGFAPRFPVSVPRGFEVTHKQVLGSDAMPYFVARLSDGMNSIAVYQWSPKIWKGESPFQGVKTSTDAYGIRYFADGDASKSITQEILRSFVLR